MGTQNRGPNRTQSVAVTRSCVSGREVMAGSVRLVVQLIDPDVLGVGPRTIPRCQCTSLRSDSNEARIVVCSLD